MNIIFHPCPAHFPEMWKSKTLEKVEPTKEQIAQVRAIYYMPDDGTERARECLKRWEGAKCIDDIAAIYARAWLAPHGFLTLDNRFVGPFFAIYDLEDFQYYRNELKLPDACLTRARDFQLPQTRQRQSWAENMGRSMTNNKVCRPEALKT